MLKNAAKICKVRIGCAVVLATETVSQFNSFTKRLCENKGSCSATLLVQGAIDETCRLRRASLGKNLECLRSHEVAHLLGLCLVFLGEVNLSTKWLKNSKAKCNDQPAVRHWKLLMKYTNTGLHRDTLRSDFCLFKIILPYHVRITQPGSFCLSFRSEDGPCAALLRRKQV